MFKVVGVIPTVVCRWESGTLVLPYSVHNLPVLENFHVHSDGDIAVCTVLIHFLAPPMGGVRTYNEMDAIWPE